MSAFARALGPVAALVLAACNGPYPEVDSQSVKEYRAELAPEILAEYLDLRARLANVAYRVRVAGGRYCATLVEPVPGVIVGTPESFDDPTVQAWAERTFGIRDGVTVVHVIPDSSFATAGLLAGDAILEVGGQKVESVEQFQSAVVTAGAGPLPIVTEREAERIPATPDLEEGCVFNVGFARGNGLLTWEVDEWEVAVPAGLLRATTEDELAIAVAHQLAHALLNFADPPVESPRVEQLADRIGLQMAAAAGYDVAAAPAFWERIAAEYPWTITPAGVGAVDEDPHQDIAGRIGEIRRTSTILATRGSTREALAQ